MRLILLAVLWRRTVTAVDAEWLAELGPMFYSVKESYAQRIAKRASRLPLATFGPSGSQRPRE